MQSRTQIVSRCVVEAKVGTATAWRVLFGGAPVNSLARQRVADWARRNGVKLAEQAPSLDALVQRAEQELGGAK
jgi:hypothetical protein